MSVTHTVKQGKHLVGIADAYGFPDHLKIWNDGANADLRKARANPNVLLPGDVVVIPDKELQSYPRGTEQRHRFKVKAKPLMLRLVLKDESDQPLDGAECLLSVDADSRKLNADSKGKVKHTVPRQARLGQMLVQHEKLNGSFFAEVGIGELDPVETVTGQIGRLNNMGYDAGAVQEPAGDDAKLQFRSAVEEFQCDHALGVDGKCGAKTQAKLKEIHGC